MRYRFAALLCALMLAAVPALGEETEVDLLKVDHRLYELGYRDENCNGKLDDVTISAIENFQYVNKLAVTGEPDADTVELLMSDDAIPEAEYLKTLAAEYQNTPVLEVGSFGDDVRDMQIALQSLGYLTGECNGVFDEATETGVYRFRVATGLPEGTSADGSVLMRLYEGEPQTWQEFIDASTAAVGDSGSAVRALQARLRKLGYFQGSCTGQYGEGTQAAVRSFQGANALEVTGDANAATCEKLYSNRAAMTAETIGADDAGAKESALELLNRLGELGYGVGENINAHTEIGIMQFQIVNGISVTGALDEETQRVLRSEEALPWADVDPVQATEEQLLKAVRNAEALLGKQLCFESELEMGQYIYLKSGISLMRINGITMTEFTSTEELRTGDIVLVDVADKDACGIVTSDGAMIYCGSDGYVVMSYINMQQDAHMYYYRPQMTENED